MLDCQKGRMGLLLTPHLECEGAGGEGEELCPAGREAEG